MNQNQNKDSYFCNIWNDDYNDYISHITTNKHKLSSYSDNLAEYYEKIDNINSELSSEIIMNFVNMESSKLEGSGSVEDSDNNLDYHDKNKLGDRLNKIDQMIHKIMYMGKSKSKGEQ